MAYVPRSKSDSFRGTHSRIHVHVISGGRCLQKTDLDLLLPIPGLLGTGPTVQSWGNFSRNGMKRSFDCSCQFWKWHFWVSCVYEVFDILTLFVCRKSVHKNDVKMYFWHNCYTCTKLQWRFLSRNGNSQEVFVQNLWDQKDWTAWNASRQQTVVPIETCP